MSWYEFLLFVHVAAAIVWLGGALFVQFHGIVVMRTNDGRRMAEFAKDIGSLTERMFVPASLLVILAGVGLMIEGNWDWGQLWVVFALVTFAASFLVGIAVLSPTSKRIGTTIEAEGPDSPNAKALIRKIFRISRVDLAFMYAIVFAMTVKPTSDDGVVIAVAAVVLVALSALFLLRGRESTSAVASEPAA
jgi:uncharacterized membrane protein